MKEIDTLAEATDNKLSKRRKLSDSPPKHDENQKQEEEEEEKLLLSYANSEEDDDYETLRYLFSYTMDQMPYILRRGGTFMPNFENAVTEYINTYSPSSCRIITTRQCKKKVMELDKKFLRFKKLYGEDLSEADVSVPRDYKMFRMFKTVWNAGQGSGGSGSGADPDVDQLGSSVEQGINVGNAMQGASGDLKYLDMNVYAGNMENPGVNVAVSVEVDGDQENVDRVVVDGSPMNQPKPPVRKPKRPITMTYARRKAKPPITMTYARRKPKPT